MIYGRLFYLLGHCYGSGVFYVKERLIFEMTGKGKFEG